MKRSARKGNAKLLSHQAASEVYPSKATEKPTYKDAM